MSERDRFSLDKIISDFEELIKELKNSQTRNQILDRGMRGDGREKYDFPGEATFFKKHYQEFEDLYKRIRKRGIEKGYIKE